MRAAHRRCYELQCKPATFEDGLNITNNAQYACLNTDSIVVKIVVRSQTCGLITQILALSLTVTVTQPCPVCQL